MTLDLVFLLIVGAFALIGFFSGFWMQLVRIGALVLAYLLAGVVGKPLGPWLGRSLGIPSLLGTILGTGLAFLFLYAVGSAVGWGILRRRERRRARKEGEDGPVIRRTWDRLAGAVLGGAKMFLVLFVLLCAVVLVEGPLTKASPGFTRILKSSALAGLARDHNLLAGMHLPVVGNLAAVGRLATDPALRAKMANDPKVQALLRHPKIKSLFNDRALMGASRRNDVAAILANPRLNQVLQDPEIQKLVSEIDLSGM
jgi:hypothetical protein